MFYDSEFENETAASSKKEATAEVNLDNESHFSIKVESSDTSAVREDEASKSNLLAQNFQEIKHNQESQMKEIVTSESSKKLIKYRTIVSYVLISNYLLGLQCNILRF